MSLSPPYLMFLGDAADQLAAKTAAGVVHWRPAVLVSTAHVGGVPVVGPPGLLGLLARVPYGVGRRHARARSHPDHLLDAGLPMVVQVSGRNQELRPPA